MDSVTLTASTQNQSKQGTAISRLPPEMFRAILQRVPAHHLIPLRSVSSEWKSEIDICRNKTCLLIVRTDWNRNNYTELLKRFTGQLKLRTNELVFIRLPFISPQSKEMEMVCLSAQFCTLLSGLFPHIEKLLIYSEFQYSAPEFSSMLRQWSPTLTTLSLRKLPSDDLCVQINQMTNLRQLNLGSTFPVSQLAPTLARVQHLSVCNLPYYKFIDDILSHLNESSQLTSLEIFFLNVQLGELTKWHRLNAKAFSRLTRLSLRSCEANVLAFICEHFSALKVLHFTVDAHADGGLTYETLFANSRHLDRLTHLTELRIDGPSWYTANVSLRPTLYIRYHIIPLCNIRILSLVNFRFDPRNLSEAVSIFCRNLCAIFPNGEKLSLYSRFHPDLGSLLEPHLKLFGNLCSLDFNEQTVPLWD